LHFIVLVSTFIQTNSIIDLHRLIKIYKIMKKIFLVAITVLLMGFNCFSQSAEKTNYLQKSRTQKTVAWVLFGTGAAINIIGVTQVNSPKNTPIVCWIVGSTIMFASIPFTVMGAKNKKRAAQLSLNTEQLYKLQNNNLYAVSYPALTMKISLGK
jgi:hypothetical protein